MERISREHSEERRRLELLFQVEKARQKEELRKRKEKKRRERLLKKKPARESDSGTKESASASGEEHKSVSPRLQSPRSPPLKAETKGSPREQECSFSVVVPGHGRVDLTHLLSNSHAKRIIERKGLPHSQQPPPAQTMLNPSTLRYLTEKMIMKDPVGWGQQEIVVDELESADEK